MRPLTAAPGAVALAAGLLAMGALLTACTDPGGLEVSGPALSPSPGTEAVYVMGGGTEAADKPPLRRPAALTLSPGAALTELRWQSWGGPTAEAYGSVRGTWCRPACAPDRPYAAKVTLGGLVRRAADSDGNGDGGDEGTAYYTRATVDPEGLPGSLAHELRDLRLPVPPR
ncbi:hypothetical protein B7P34_14135 [Streptosporangium nondiastaticum]|uniref:Lipoprotein n=1 Tax=Streptosporangium nondiastaticum TaxID=35764 RepID=A0A9X7PHL0_9ACTN|nr:hypothetical protein [Streptosporangium nondiastaticum]PSJ28132.1 hypothetical protein B7P34_14135 [Streptosporangium nondiastaticum]